MNDKTITIVSGLPRSGTSMMMKMLEAGGAQILTDDIRQADEDNPNGYYEFEKVKQVKEDSSWLKEASGKTVKIISMLLMELPQEYTYKIIFMRRAMKEILASQKQMLSRNKKPTDTIADEKMAELFDKHLKQITAWLEIQPNFKVLYINYNEVLSNPRENIAQIDLFLDKNLNRNKMEAVIDQKLYRQIYRT